MVLMKVLYSIISKYLPHNKGWVTNTKTGQKIGGRSIPKKSRFDTDVYES